MSKFVTALKYMFLIICAFFSIFPFYWMVVSATNPTFEIIQGKLTFGNYLLENIKNAFETADLVSAFGNSAFLAIIITIVSLLVSSIAGYAFAMFPSKLRNIMFTCIVMSMMVPFAAKMIPMFRIFSRWKLLNTYSAIILPAVATPFLIFFFRQNTYAFSIETLEAARVDGMSEWGIFFHIYMPMMKSSYAAAGIVAFMSSWNNYMWPMLSLQSQDKYTLPLAVANLASDFEPDYGMIMIGIIISTLPMLLVFFVLQKSFVEGMVGSVK